MIALVDGDFLAPAANWIFRGRFNTFSLPLEVEEWADRQLETLRTCVYQEDTMIAVQGPGNFREVLYPEYKRSKSRLNNRSQREPWFIALREFVASQPDAVLSYGCEADDLIRMWAYHSEPGEFAVVSSDKDLDCIPGLHINPKGYDSYEVDEAYATRHYWTQMLMGDSVDNIPGIPGVGPKKAAMLLDGAETTTDYVQRVVSAYRQYSPDSWESNLITNGRLLHMWRFEGDFFRL